MHFVDTSFSRGNFLFKGEMAPALESTDARNKLEDLSGITIQPGENPYKALIEACEDDAVFPTSSLSLLC